MTDGNSQRPELSFIWLFKVFFLVWLKPSASDIFPAGKVFTIFKFPIEKETIFKGVFLKI